MKLSTITLDAIPDPHIVQVIKINNKYGQTVITQEDFYALIEKAKKVNWEIPNPSLVYRNN